MNVHQDNSQYILSKEVTNAIDHWLSKFPSDQKQSAILPALTIVQKHHNGWVTDAHVKAVAEYLSMPVVSVYEVATFYSMIQLAPVGKYKIDICVNISCMLCGADKIVKHIKKRLGIESGTTPDGRFTLHPVVECFAACVSAPMMIINGEYHENLTIEKVDKILEACGLE